MGATYDANNAYAAFPFLKEMRAAPSVTLPTAGQSSNNITFIAAGNNYPSTTGSNTASFINRHSCSIMGSSYGGLTANAASQVYSIQTNSIKVDAEI